MQYIKRNWLQLVGILAILFVLWQTAQLHDLGRATNRLSQDVAALQAEQDALRDALEAIPPPLPPVPESENLEPTFQPLDIPLAPELQEHTYNLCEEYGIPFETALSLMYHESRFQLDAVGHNPNGTYDSGPMQINSVNHGWLLDDHGLDITDAVDNIEAALLILAMHLEDGDLEYALTAYNCGAAGAASMGGKSAFADMVLEFDLEEVGG